MNLDLLKEHPGHKKQLRHDLEIIIGFKRTQAMLKYEKQLEFKLR